MLILIGIILAVLSDVFLTVTNLNNVTRQVSFVIISGCAVTLLMFSGNFDLTIGSTLGLTGILSAYFVPLGIHLWFSIILATLIGTSILYSGRHTCGLFGNSHGFQTWCWSGNGWPGI